MCAYQKCVSTNYEYNDMYRRHSNNCCNLINVLHLIFHELMLYNIFWTLETAVMGSTVESTETLSTCVYSSVSVEFFFFPSVFAWVQAPACRKHKLWMFNRNCLKVGTYSFE